MDASGGLTFDTRRGDSDDVANIKTEAENMGNDDEQDEIVIIDESYYYLGHVIRLLAATHTLLAFILLAAYYHLKVLYLILIHELKLIMPR